MINFKELLPKVKAMVFDVDGVLAESQVLLHPSGEPMRTVSIKDGYALRYARLKNFPLAIITGGKTEAVYKRFAGLGIEDIHIDVHWKKEKLEEFIAKYKLDPATILYMGDDIPDYEAMQMVGIPVCPADAAQEIKDISVYISDKNGGEGCARDIIEQVMKAQGLWMKGQEAFGW
jgi:3-deoxy-D-manno-octulosonate 8-phosphate phosphatase (KDO 8-P phosphatase)